jgi:hypothetical protein
MTTDPNMELEQAETGVSRQLTLQEKQDTNFTIAIYLSLILLPVIISSVFGLTAYECFAVMVIQGIIFLALRNTFEWTKGAIFLIETYRLQIFILTLCFVVLDLLFWYKTEQSVFLDGILGLFKEVASFL